MILLLALPLAAVPLFVEDTAALGPQPCGPGPGTGCYTNYLILADLDGDGDLDVVFPNADGYYTQGAAQPLVILENDGTGTFTDISAVAVGAFSGWLRQVALGDVDGDGDLDLYAPHAWGGDDAFFVNDGGVYTDEASVRLDARSRAGAARFGDVDMDGDLDLFVSDWGTSPPDSAGSAHLYLNDGSGVFFLADERLPVTVSPDGAGPIDLDLFDADGDFDLDLLIDSRIGNAQLWRNDGAGSFSDVSAVFPNQPGGYAYGPSACDVDGDGDLDVWIDNATASNREQLLINDGAGGFTDETSSRVTGNPAADDNGVVCADVDGDGDLDAVIPSLTGNERVLMNDGSGVFAAVTDAFPAVSDATLWIDFGDLDGDHRLDAVTGQGEAGSYLNRLYRGLAAQPADDDPPVFRAVEAVASVPPGGTLRVRFAAQDASVTDVGPRLSGAGPWMEWTVDGVAQPDAVAVFSGGDLFRATAGPLPSGRAGTYRVCATDAAGNSSCSAGHAFTIAPGGGDDDDGGATGCGCRMAATAGSRPLAVVAAMLVGALAVTARR